MKITICCLGQVNYDEFKHMFEDASDVEIYHGSIFNMDADAIVSPANSFGNMDGGIDQAIVDELGQSIEKDVQDYIKNYSDGELPVGQSIYIDLKNKRYNYLIASPTLRVPMDVSQTQNAYHAFRSTLRLAKAHPDIHSIVLPTFCTGIGRMSARVSATQMKMAYVNIMRGRKLTDFDLMNISQIKLNNPDYISQ